jgi:hypothetical protein
MDTPILLAVIAILIFVIAAGTWYFTRQLSTKRLKEQFGPEYDRTVGRLRSRDVAEKELREREQRVTRFKIVPLPPDESRHYKSHWSAVQARFVDEPKEAVEEANDLIQEVMRKRGYPITDFEQAAADLSVEHPRVVENYRAACAIADRNQRGAADTEELRQAFVYYRVLFDDLLDGKVAPETHRQPGFRKPADRFGFKKSTKGGLRA